MSREIRKKLRGQLMNAIRSASGTTGLPTEPQRRLLEVVEFGIDALLKEDLPSADMVLINRLHDLLTFGSDTDRTLQARYARAATIIEQRMPLRECARAQGSDLDRQWMLLLLTQLSDVDSRFRFVPLDFLSDLLDRADLDKPRKGRLGLDRVLAELALKCNAFDPGCDLKTLQRRIAEGRRNASESKHEDRTAPFVHPESRAAAWMQVDNVQDTHDDSESG